MQCVCKLKLLEVYFLCVCVCVWFPADFEHSKWIRHSSCSRSVYCWSCCNRSGRAGVYACQNPGEAPDGGLFHSSQSWAAGRCRPGGFGEARREAAPSRAPGLKVLGHRAGHTSETCFLRGNPVIKISIPKLRLASRTWQCSRLSIIIHSSIQGLPNCFWRPTIVLVSLQPKKSTPHSTAFEWGVFAELPTSS